MKLITKIKRAGFQRKTELWIESGLCGDEARAVVMDMVLSMPAGHYRLHGRDYGTNLVDAVYGAYGWMPSMHIDERMLLGMQVLYPDRVYASFTLGLDAIEIKK